jgi:N-acetylglutamate synthase
MKARYVVRLTPQDVGERVTLRLRTHAPSGQPAMTDVVGILRAWHGGRLSVERRDRSIIEVAAGDLVAGRVVSEPPPRRRG